MKWNSILPVLLTLLSVVSCGKSAQELLSAPTSDTQAGVIASCTTTAQAKSLSDELGIQYRVINAKRNLIEFVGTNQQVLEQKLPRAKFKKNRIIQTKLISGDFQAQSVSNYPFYGAHTPQYRSASIARYFPHLEQVEALSDSTHLGKDIVIAVVDTGVYYNHPHLSPNILTNQNDKHGNDSNNIDDDGNGYKDDYAGWDFYNGDAYPIDDNGHGTHVAGLAASTYMGIAPKAKILPIKVLSADGRGDLGTIAAGILYAIDMGADIVNLSLGGAGSGPITNEIRQLINTVKIAKDNNSLIIAAAGNGGNDGVGDCNDNSPVYPANIQEKNVISVASVDLYNSLTNYSNFGGGTVHVAAPGGDQYTGGLSSAAIPYCYGPCNSGDIPYVSNMGTSMATPVVAGLAAVIKSKNKSLSHSQIKTIIMSSSTRKASLEGLVQSGGVINLRNALNQL
jgi:subtilisin family serine protease